MCKHLPDERIYFQCIVKVRANKCPYETFKNRFHLNNHIKNHILFIFKVKLDYKYYQERQKKYNVDKFKNYEFYGKFIQESNVIFLEEI